LGFLGLFSPFSPIHNFWSTDKFIWPISFLSLPVPSLENRQIPKFLIYLPTFIKIPIYKKWHKLFLNYFNPKMTQQKYYLTWMNSKFRRKRTHNLMWGNSKFLWVRKRKLWLASSYSKILFHFPNTNTWKMTKNRRKIGAQYNYWALIIPAIVT
jgi:hypothetical protein